MVEKKPSMLTMAWGAMMKFAFAFDRHPLTFTYQGAMPRLSVPPLKLTIDRWLTSIKPVTSDAEYAQFETAARDFLNNGGKKLQAMLVAKSFFSTNYVSDWWEKYVYLRGRSPILINSVFPLPSILCFGSRTAPCPCFSNTRPSQNYYGLGFAGYIPTDVQTSRAATLVHQYMRFKQLLDAEQLTPMTVRGWVSSKRTRRCRPLQKAFHAHSTHKFT
jgi:carnitine O-palmitoyltransferase 1